MVCSSVSAATVVTAIRIGIHRRSVILLVILRRPVVEGGRPRTILAGVRVLITAYAPIVVVAAVRGGAIMRRHVCAVAPRVAVDPLLC